MEGDAQSGVSKSSDARLVWREATALGKNGAYQGKGEQMADSTWVAVAGLISTAAVGVAGAYFSYKAQRTPLRQALFERQIAVMSDFTVLGTQACKAAGLLVESSRLEEDQLNAVGAAWDEAQEGILTVVQRGSVVLPSPLYSAFTQFRLASELFDESFIKGENVTKAYYELTGTFSRTGMLCRALAGADALSTESLSLHSRDGYGAFEAVEAEGMARLMRYFWGARRRRASSVQSDTESS
ncbi:hypothetical protein [Stenotrophomonas pavanii]|uniref:hypothetical protein n=1 Tax=Stenotrophomonas pavanii TaxID=487698 RepID=UPI0015F4E515|nr:hypothetical protein [Stenotrophomonas pavanii]